MTISLPITCFFQHISANSIPFSQVSIKLALQVHSGMLRACKTVTCLPGRTASSSGAQDRRSGESSPCLYPNICPAEINFWKTSCLGFFPVVVRWVIHSLATLSFLNLRRNSYCTGEKMEDQFLCLFTSLWFSRINHVTTISSLMHKDAWAMSSSSQQAQSVSNP